MCKEIEASRCFLRMMGKMSTCKHLTLITPHKGLFGESKVGIWFRARG